MYCSSWGRVWLNVGEYDRLGEGVCSPYLYSLKLFTGHRATYIDRDTILNQFLPLLPENVLLPHRQTMCHRQPMDSVSFLFLAHSLGTAHGSSWIPKGRSSTTHQGKIAKKMLNIGACYLRGTLQGNPSPL
jgi:hypothetical protein